MRADPDHHIQSRTSDQEFLKKPPKWGPSLLLHSALVKNLKAVQSLVSLCPFNRVLPSSTWSKHHFLQHPSRISLLWLFLGYFLPSVLPSFPFSASVKVILLCASSACSTCISSSRSTASSAAGWVGYIGHIFAKVTCRRIGSTWLPRAHSQREWIYRVQSYLKITSLEPRVLNFIIKSSSSVFAVITTTLSLLKDTRCFVNSHLHPIGISLWGKAVFHNGRALVQSIHP